MKPKNDRIRCTVGNNDGDWLPSLREWRGGAPSGDVLSEERRRELLSEVRQGVVHELVLDAVVYRQSMAPRPLPVSKVSEANHNFSTFRPEDLTSLARSFRGRQFLKDHDRRDLGSVGGFILESEALEEGGWVEFHQTLHLVKPWAVEAALDGTLRSFSISADPRDSSYGGLMRSLRCTACDGPFLSTDCPHMPGDRVRLEESGGSVIVEVQWKNMTGAETSGVSFAAVDHTAITEIRAALADEYRPLKAAGEDTMDLKELRERLNLPEDAPVDDVLKAQSAMMAQTEIDRRAAEVARDAAREELAARAAADAERTKLEVAAARSEALADGRLVPGDERDKLFIELVADPDTGLERGRRFLAALSPIVPVGQPMQLEAPPIEPTGAGGAGEMAKILEKHYGASALEVEIQNKQMAQLGLTVDDFLAYGQHTREDD